MRHRCRGQSTNPPFREQRMISFCHESQHRQQGLNKKPHSTQGRHGTSTLYSKLIFTPCQHESPSIEASLYFRSALCPLQQEASCPVHGIFSLPSTCACLGDEASSFLYWGPQRPHVRILHFGSKALENGFQKPWFPGCLSLCGLLGL